MPFFRPNPTKSTSASIRSYVKVRLTRLGARVERSRHGRITATGPIADTDAIPSFIGGGLRCQQAGESEAGRASSPASRDQAREAWHADLEVDADASGNTEEMTGPLPASHILPLSSPSSPQSDKAGEVADSIGGAEFQELLSAWWGRPKSILSDDGSVVSGEEFRGRRRQAWWDGMGKAAPRRQKKRSQARKASPYRGAASQQANGKGVSQEA
ncbi:hypothetical protein LTR12_005978 [Friedmanniomyces endolithicus]|nr:hypothetical protein LTR74_011080 [Friedmanniomyces endolithicus]KAK1819664.1 hypothetical protein LTR12_005978 [Friedmanniomyces endolithicus]